MTTECCFCREYAEPVGSEYYHKLGKKINVPSRILSETKNWYAIPTLGCFTVGYVLLVCKHHYLSLATLSEELYFELLGLKTKVEKILYDNLGYSCLAFEHGTTCSSLSGANSVEHVHLHLLPFSQIIWPDMEKHNDLENFCRMDSYKALFSRWKASPPETYLLFQDIDGSIYYRPDAKGMPSQFFRKCLSPYLGISQWDWKEEYCQINFMKTLELFGKKI